MLTYRYIEMPLKDRQQQRPANTVRKANTYVVTIAASSLLVAGAGATMVLNQPENQVANVFEDWDWETHPGAMVTTPSYEDTPETDDFLPEVDQLPAERAVLYDRDERCIQRSGNDPGTDEVIVCEDPEKPANPTATVVISGGSHSVHWHSAFEELAREYNWELLVVNKDACVLRDTTQADTNTCAAWNENYTEWLQDNDVDLVVANGSRMSTKQDEFIQDGAEDRWQDITETGAELVLMRGTPRPGDVVADCLADGKTPNECGADTTQIADTNPLEEVSLPEGAHQIDMIEQVCPEGTAGDSDQCPAVVGN